MIAVIGFVFEMITTVDLVHQTKYIFVEEAIWTNCDHSNKLLSAARVTPGLTDAEVTSHAQSRPVTPPASTWAGTKGMCLSLVSILSILVATPIDLMYNKLMTNRWNTGLRCMMPPKPKHLKTLLYSCPYMGIESLIN